MGLASPEEIAEFERICREYPEVLEARDAFERSLEQRTMEQVVDPPASVREKVFARIGGEKMPIRRQVESKSEQPGATGLVISMRRTRFVAAASVVLLLGSALLNYYYYSQYKVFSSKYDQLVQEQGRMASSNQGLQTKLEEYESTLGLIKDPAMTIVKMPSIPNSPGPNSLTTVYWNTKTHDVYLLVNNLPFPAAGKQYQLWALVNGKPVDAGIFEINQDSINLVKMKNIPQAQAFAITLENRGGSPTPTMSAMYVLGKVS